MEFDKAFIKKLKSNDGKAQKAFYQQLAPKMYGVCLRYAASRAEADDMLQEGFIRVFNYIKDSCHHIFSYSLFLLNLDLL